jgi:dihydroorotate dehydrogenase
MFAALKPLLFALDPEAAHNLTLAALKTILAHTAKPSGGTK